MTAADQPAINPCRCGCGGTSRGLFVPGHDARYKSELANRMWAASQSSGASDVDPAQIDANLDAIEAVRRVCDEIDTAYGRPPGKWRALVEKQAENLRLSAARDTQRASRGTPVRRAARRLVAASREAEPESEITAQEARSQYVEELIDRLQHRRAAGMVGWAVIGSERTAVRIWETGLDRGISTIKVRTIVTGEFHDLAPDLFHRDIELEHAN